MKNIHDAMFAGLAATPLSSPVPPVIMDKNAPPYDEMIKGGWTNDRIVREGFGRWRILPEGSKPTWYHPGNLDQPLPDPTPELPPVIMKPGKPRYEAMREMGWTDEDLVEYHHAYWRERMFNAQEEAEEFFNADNQQEAEEFIRNRINPAEPDPLYKSLKNVLDRAYEQAASGKGKERHGQNKPFEEQPMQTISELLNSPIGMAYQVIKKTQEAQRMESEAAIRELFGAINYAAGMIIFLEKSNDVQD